MRGLLSSIFERKIIRSLMVAGAGAAVDFSLFAALIYGLHIHYLWAGVGGFLVATLINYLLSIRFVFSAGTRFPRGVELAVIYAVSATGLLWHQLILYLAVEELRLHVLLSKLLALGIVFFWNYLIRRNYIFSGDQGARS